MELPVFPLHQEPSSSHNSTGMATAPAMATDPTGGVYYNSGLAKSEGMKRKWLVNQPPQCHPPNNKALLRAYCLGPRWWFQIFFYVHPENWGNDPIWRLHIFQMCWFNYQLEVYIPENYGEGMICNIVFIWKSLKTRWKSWDTPKWWALEKVDSGFKSGHFWYLLDFWGVNLWFGSWRGQFFLICS